MYEYADGAVLRAALRADAAPLPPWPGLGSDTSGHVEEWRRWLRGVWSQDDVAESIEVASPELARQARAACGGRGTARQVRRAVMSVARYVLRMTSRATPFGLFAGVASARVGAELAVRWGKDHRAVAEVDARWLEEVITRLEQCRDLRLRLFVVANNLCVVRDDRLISPSSQQPDAAQTAAPVEVSVRHTPAVQTALRAARAPIPFGDLVAQLAGGYPQTPRPVIETMLAELLTRRVLVSSLRPPLTVTNTLEHILDQLGAARADRVPDMAPTLRKLRQIQQELTRFNQTGSTRDSVLRSMAALVDTVEKPLRLDLRVDCDLVLPTQVAREAAGAASALSRLTPNPKGFPAWRDYHSRFLERYGSGALVPVTELVNAGSGLGLPAGYRGSHHKVAPAGLSERDRRLLALAQRATLAEHGFELTLDDEVIRELSGDFDDVQIPPHTELCFHLESPTRDALKRGEFQLVVAVASRTAGAMTGRFLHLLDAPDRERTVAAYAGLPTINDGALPAQVSSPPLYTRTDNVARAPAVLPHTISLAEHRAPSDDVIPLDDLAVSADARRMYLVSLSRQTTVEPAVMSAVDFRNHTQPLARFLAEITTGLAATYTPFSWGAAESLPFLPRVRYRRSVLSPARWSIPAADLAGPRASWKEWTTSLTAWRGRFRVPDAVYLGDDDRRIRLDLSESFHLHLLRTDLNRAGRVMLVEAPDAAAWGWFDGRAHEIALPLAASHPSAWPSVPRRAARRPTTGRDLGHLPGASAWLVTKLYGHPDRQDTILTAHLPRLLSAWDAEPEWWFVRYQDPQDHLRLRFRLADREAFGPAAGRVAAWAGELRRLGLAGQMQLDTYYPETGRYGTGPAMGAAEAAFAADSSAVLAQLGLTTRARLHARAVTAASFVNMAVAFAGSADEGMSWLIERTRRGSVPAPPREVFDQAVRLADPRDGWAGLQAADGGSEALLAWRRRARTLENYRVRLTEADQPDAKDVLPSLLHMHHIRMNGVDEDAESLCHHLARAAALAWRAQKGRTPR